jgi:hypothetical protein
VYFWKNVLLPHLHDRLEMRRLIVRVERPYHGHPHQPKTEVDCCQDKSRLAYKTPNHEHS